MTELSNKQMEQQAERARDVYEPPVLLQLGDVRDLTLGGSPGTGDSGNPGIQQF